MQKSELKKTGCSHFLKKLCRLLREGQLEETIKSLAGTQGTEGEECEKEPLLESALLWKGKMDATTKMERYAKSEFLVSQWDDFARALIPHALPDQFVYALKYFVYSAALKGYLELYRLSGIADVEVLSRLGKIYKGLGNYERAIEALELANQQKKNDPRILAELADCYAQVSEIKAAKLFFRESLFIDPAVFDLDNCESSFIIEIVARIRAKGIPENEVNCWIPVYGAILGVFSVKRELKPVEISRLTQSIGELEKKYTQEADGKVKALLINRYFWLIDHYNSIKAPKEDIDKALLKIKQLVPDIYERYIH